MRKLLFAIFGAVILMSGFLLFKISSVQTSIQQSKELRATSSWLDLPLSESTLSKSGKDFINVVFFNPGCEYCQEEAKELVEKRDLFDNVHWYWISGEGKITTQNFVKKYRLGEITDLDILYDSTSVLSSRIGISSIPQILIYSSDGALITEFKGETKIEAISQVVKK